LLRKREPGRRRTVGGADHGLDGVNERLDLGRAARTGGLAHEKCVLALAGAKPGETEVPIERRIGRIVEAIRLLIGSSSGEGGAKCLHPVRCSLSREDGGAERKVCGVDLAHRDVEDGAVAKDVHLALLPVCAVVGGNRGVEVEKRLDRSAEELHCRRGPGDGWQGQARDCGQNEGLPHGGGPPALLTEEESVLLWPNAAKEPGKPFSLSGKIPLPCGETPFPHWGNPFPRQLQAFPRRGKPLSPPIS